MNRIRIDNYEEFALDYLEGNLSEDLCVEMELFLALNPTIKEELADFDLCELQVDSISYSNKDKLKLDIITPYKDICEDNYEDLFIAFYERVLKHNELDDLKSFLNLNPFLQVEFDTYKKVYLQPDSISYPSKDLLKKKELKLAPIISYLSYGVAASFLLVVGLKFVVNKNHAFQNDKLTYLSQHLPQVKTKGTSTELLASSVQIKSSYIKKAVETKKTEKLQPIIHSENLSYLPVRDVKLNDVALANNFDYLSYRFNDDFFQETFLADLDESSEGKRKSIIGRVLSSVIKGSIKRKSTSSGNVNNSLLGFFKSAFSVTTNYSDTKDGYISEKRCGPLRIIRKVPKNRELRD